MALALAASNITPEYLDARLQQVANLEEAYSIQRYLIGQTRQIQQQRREAIEELGVWMKRFIAVARVIFAEDQPKLAKLGITVKTSRGDDENKEGGEGGGESKTEGASKIEAGRDADSNGEGSGKSEK